MAGRDTDYRGVAGGPARHTPVLLDEAMRLLAPAAGGTFVDGTFGAGGYIRAILASGARVIAIDRDRQAIAAGEALAAAAGGRLTLVAGSFSGLDRIAAGLGSATVDGIVLDVGVSSMQLDDPARGFSFRNDGPLDMRMCEDGPSAADVVNRMETADLARIIAILGEERRARAVARAIAAARRHAAIAGTLELARIVAAAVGRQPQGIDPATRTFQALRIFVNRELDELAAALGASERLLGEGGRLVVVAFHSLEDRVVKRFLADRSTVRAGTSRHAPEQAVAPATFELLTRTPVVPGADEVARNPRARSAKLRAARRTAAAAAARPLDPAGIGVPALPRFAS
jgi:16S rRNA (cytosine1402-N4)-methyltransferase